MKIIVPDGKFEKSIRLFKKKVDDVGILKDYKEKEFYTKPSTEKKLKRSAAKKRWQKYLSASKIPERKY